MSSKRVGGVISLKVDGQLYRAKGAFDYDIGAPKREGIVGQDGTHGYKELPKIAMIEGSITDEASLNLEAFLNASDATVTLELANSKVIVIREAWYAGDGKGNTEEGEIEVKFEGMGGEEIR